jgi:hypothetical protein
MPFEVQTEADIASIEARAKASNAALRPSVLTVYAVERCIDFERWDRQLRVQEVELASIADFADKMKNLPQIGGEA